MKNLNISWRNIIFIAGVLLLMGAVWWLIDPSVNPVSQSTPSKVLATPFYTPTTTNPNEEFIAKLNYPVTGMAISPNDKTMIFNLTPSDASRNEVWKLNLATKQLTQLSVNGGKIAWSPDGQTIAIQQGFSDTVYEVRLLNSNGTDEKVLINREQSGLLDFYWATANTIGLVSFEGVEEIDLTGHLVNQINLTIHLIHPLPMVAAKTL